MRFDSPIIQYTKERLSEYEVRVKEILTKRAKIKDCPVYSEIYKEDNRFLTYHYINFDRIRPGNFFKVYFPDGRTLKGKKKARH